MAKDFQYSFQRLLLTVVLLLGIGFFPFWLFLVFLVLATAVFDWYIESVLLLGIGAAGFATGGTFYLFVLGWGLFVLVINKVHSFIFNK